jgi:hypothetical protein
VGGPGDGGRNWRRWLRCPEIRLREDLSRAGKLHLIHGRRRDVEDLGGLGRAQGCNRGDLSSVVRRRRRE